MMAVRFPLPEFRRDRMPEWILAAYTLGWGVNAVLDMIWPNGVRHTMDSPFFAPLTSTGVGQWGWGVFATLVGLAHLVALYVNGSRPRGSTMVRAIGSACSTFFWAALWIGVMQLPYRSGAVLSYGAIVTIDGLALFYAARELVPVFRSARALADVQ